MDEIKSENIYITVEGRAIPYKPISFTKRDLIKNGLEEEFRERGEPLDPPVIETEVYGGDKIEQELTDGMLVVEGDEEESARRKALWDAHIDAKDRYEKELSKSLNHLTMSAILIDLPEDDKWIAEQKKLHIRIPENADKLREHYIQTEILTSLEDVFEINSLIFEKSAVRDLNYGEVAAAKASFRDTIRRALQGEGTENIGTGEDKDTA